MNELNLIRSLGLALPSPAYILGAFVFGVVGYVTFRRGRKLSRLNHTCVGIVLMLYPYAISETWLLWIVGLALCGWLYATWS